MVMISEQTIFQIILHGGNGKSSSMEAIAAAKEGNFVEANKKLKQASEALNEAHHVQTQMIQNEVNGAKSEVSLLMVHAQDHLMNALTVRDLATVIVDLYETVSKKEVHKDE
jgi:cellobiose PTS system EIIA component